MSEGREEEVGVEVLSAFPSAILYLNADFDGGNFYFTELDAKTVTVSAPLSPSLGGETKPQGAVGRMASWSSWWPALPFPNQGASDQSPVLFSSGLWEARQRGHPLLDLNDPVSLLKAGYGLCPVYPPRRPL